MKMSLIGITTIALSLAVTGIGLTSQVRKNHARRSMDGLSFFYFFILAVSYSFWVAYGVYLHDYVVIIPMSIGGIMSWVVVFQFYLYRGSKSIATKTASQMTELRTKAKTALSERTEHRKDEILELIKRELEHQAKLAQCSVADLKTGITRVDVERLLGVSESTARKYLNQLENEGVLRQIGESGPDVTYTLK